jgi:hypothetical protein
MLSNEQVTQIRASRHEDRRAEALARVEAAEKIDGMVSTADLDVAYGSNPDGEPLRQHQIEDNIARKSKLWRQGRLTP